MSVILKRVKKYADRTVRCYVTLDCHAGCPYCSADVGSITDERKAHSIPAEVWAEGINRRNRPTVIGGGEPFLYSELPELFCLLRPKLKVEVYTNLQHDIEPFLEKVQRYVRFLVSLHQGTDLEAWAARARQLLEAGHGVRYHIIKQPGWSELVKFIQSKEEVNRGKVNVCDNQCTYPRSRGVQTNQLHPSVTCKGRIYLFGPLGYRYSCVRLMGIGGSRGRGEHISDPDGVDWMEVQGCPHFGFCCGCDNLIEGEVRDD